jgi:hypothetical protein
VSGPVRRPAVAHRPVVPAKAADQTGTDAEAHTRNPRARTLVAAAERPWPMAAAPWTAARRGPSATAPSTAGTAQRCRRSAARRPGRTEIPAARGARTPGYRNQLDRPSSQQARPRDRARQPECDDCSLSTSHSYRALTGQQSPEPTPGPAITAAFRRWANPGQAAGPTATGAGQNGGPGKTGRWPASRAVASRRDLCPNGGAISATWSPGAIDAGGLGAWLLTPGKLR